MTTGGEQSTTEQGAPGLGAALGLAFVLGFPSLKIQRYAGLWGVVAYVPVLVAGLWFVRRVAAPYVLRRMCAWTAWALAGLTILAAVVAYAAVYPRATAGGLGGGSDRDEALNIGVREMLAGRYPYYARTLVPGRPHEMGLDGNPLSPMPGELLLAVPFVLLGNGTFQTFFWLVLFFVAAESHLRDARSALLLLWTMLGLAPVVAHEVMTGGDLLAIGLWTTVVSTGLLRTARPAGPVRGAAAAAFVLGVALSSRPTFLLVAPAGAVALVRQAGWRRGAALTGLVALAYAAATLPFYCHAPAAFSPLHAFEKVTRFERLVPHAGAWAAALAAVAAVAVAMVRWPRGGGDAVTEAFLRRASWALAVPVVSTVVLSSFDRRTLEFAEFAWYGLSFLPLAALGTWRSFLGRTAGGAADRPDGGSEPAPDRGA